MSAKSSSFLDWLDHSNTKINAVSQIVAPHLLLRNANHPHILLINLKSIKRATKCTSDRPNHNLNYGKKYLRYASLSCILRRQLLAS